MTLFASFLAGSLLTLLLPTFLLIALVVWYMLFLRRVPEPTDGEQPAAPAVAHPLPRSLSLVPAASLDASGAQSGAIMLPLPDPPVEPQAPQPLS